MDPLSVTASIIAILQLSAKVLSYLNDVKDAPKGRAQCAIEASNLHNLLTNLRFRLEEGHDHRPWFSAVQALAVENGPFDQFKQTLEGLQTKMTDGGRLKKFGEALVWKLKKDEVDSMLARMERLKTLVEIALSMDHFKLSQAIKNDTDSIRTNVSAIESAVNKIQHRQITASQLDLLEWISPSDYPTLQSDIIKRRQEGTCQWFLDAPKVTQWLNEPKATLFCPGIPGAGKTMVAAIAIDQLLNSAQNSAYGVAYVYCNYKSQADQNPLSILAALLKQLGQSRPSALGPLENLHQKHAGHGTKPSLDNIYSALQEVISQYAYVYLVVDALDECLSETRKQLLPKLFDLQKNADIRLMATSRFVPDIVDAFRSALRLEVAASDEDIKRFVAGQMSRLPRCVERNTSLRDLVQERIVEAVGGMFLLARLHIDSISNNTTAKEVKSTLATLSKGAAALDQAYSEALERIEGQRSSYSRLAKNVLTWIVFAKRPLSTAEICCALAVEPGEAELDPENVPDVDDIVSVCAGLVVVDEESEIIRLVHYTTQEYFERIREQWTPNAQLDIASVCLTYLSFDAFKSGSCSTYEDYEERLRQNSLLDYATNHWGVHATTVQSSVSRLASIFLWDSNLVSSAVQAMSTTYMHGGQFLNQMTGLHLTAILGLLNLSEMLVSQSGKNISFIDSKDSDGRTPLSYAAAEGHDAVVEMLLARREVDPDSKDHSSETTLSWAVTGGHNGTVKLLPMSKRVDSRGSYGWKPLTYAVLNKHEHMVQTLLASDELDPNLGDPEDKQTPLLLAARKGHKAILNLLLASNKVDANLSSADGRTPLHWAATNGHETIVKMLLEKDKVNPDSKDKHGRTPLLEAAEHGYVAIVSLLLTRDINPNSKDIHKEFTPLLGAAHSGHATVVKLLLASSKVDPNATDFVGCTSMYLAAERGHEAIVKLLLASDKVDPNVKDMHGCTSLHWAAKRGREAVVKLFLANPKVNLNLKDKEGRSALYWASKRGHEAIVKMLLASGRVDTE